MKKATHFHISLYIIVPFVIVGLNFLAVIVTYQLYRHFSQGQGDPFWPVVAWTIVIFNFSGLVGLLLVRIFLQPVHRFAETAAQFPILTPIAQIEKQFPGSDQLNHYSILLDQMVNVLSKIEAHQLFPDIIGESKILRSVMTQMLKVAPEDATVLILGESGTGKELVAASIHEHSHRRSYPLVKLNCAAIPETLLESELFGFEAGAFTGADKKRIGKFEQAHQGTLFLDEIGDMLLNTQAKILRVLQDKEIVRIGGKRPVLTDVRIIAATNQDLGKMVKDGLFREDLFYRLNVFPLNLPPLRERPDDIGALVNHFLKRAPRPTRLADNVLSVLSSYQWPGNIRELENVIERATIMAEGGVVELTHLPQALLQAPLPLQQSSLQVDSKQNLDEDLRSYEKVLIERALLKAQGNQVRAAELLGINQRSLWYRVKKHELDVARFKLSATGTGEVVDE